MQRVRWGVIPQVLPEIAALVDTISGRIRRRIISGPSAGRARARKVETLI